jgi:hypothetical protein
VLLAVTDHVARREMALALRGAGFAVWQAEEYLEAVVLLHGSPRRLVTIVSSDLVAVLQFAASDRRMVHHHVYIALETASAPFEDDLQGVFPYLTLLTLAAPAPDELARVVSKAAQMLGGEPAGYRELVAR